MTEVYLFILHTFKQLNDESSLLKAFIITFDNSGNCGTNKP